jgi:hypothetical protein
VQSIVSYGIAFRNIAFDTHIKKLHTTLHCLVKYIFNKPRLFPTTVLYNECKILSIKSPHIMLVFSIVFKYINTISTPTRSYNTRFVKDINIISIPKLRTTFCQSGPYLIFINICLKCKICIRDFANFKQLKRKLLSLDLNT